MAAEMPAIPLRALALCFAVTLIACADPNPDAMAECELTERAVESGEVFENLVPDELIADIERPTSGLLEWYVAPPGVAIDPPAGTTQFILEIDVAPDIRVREGRKVGDRDDRIFCPSDLLLDATVRLASDDGGLAEEWRTTATAAIGAPPGVLMRFVDPAFDGSFSLEIDDAVREPYDSEEMFVELFALGKTEQPRAMGDIIYNLSTIGDGTGEVSTIRIANLRPADN